MTATAYKNFDFCETDFGEVVPVPSAKPQKKNAAWVSYFRITKCRLGFRECARLVRIAEENDALIRLVAGRSTGTTSSILSLVKMGIGADTPVAVSISGGNAGRVFEECMKVLDGAL